MEEEESACVCASVVGGDKPEATPLRHLLLQVSLLALLPCHTFVVGGEAEDGSRPLVCRTESTVSLTHTYTHSHSE